MKLLSKNIGIIAFLGPFARHQEKLKELNIHSTLISNVDELDSVDALIIPGTELRALQFALKDLLPKIAKRVNKNMPILLTGEATVLLDQKQETALSQNKTQIQAFSNHCVKTKPCSFFKKVENLFLQKELVKKDKNSQLCEENNTRRFNDEVRLKFSDTRNFTAPFVRSPKVLFLGKDWTTLATKSHDAQDIVMFEKDNILACTFYPELSNDLRIHEYFVTKI